MNKFSSIFFMVMFLAIPCKKKIDKGFEALEMYDYFKAKELFSKSLRKEPVASAFGLSKVFYEKRNHYHDLDSAKKYIDQAIFHYDILVKNERMKLSRWSIDSIALADHLDSIADQVFDDRMHTFSVNQLNGFIKAFPVYSKKQIALDLRDQRAFDIAKNDGSLFALQEFMVSYPKSKQYQEAKGIYEYQKFTQHTSIGTEQELVDFIRDHQDSPYLLQAQDDLFLLYLLDDKMERYTEFIEKYPNDPNVQVAMNNLLELSLYDFSAESLSAFLSIYPEMNNSPSVLKYLEHFRNVENSLDPYYSKNYSGDKELKDLQDYTEGLKKISENDKIGFKNLNDSLIIPVIFDDVLDLQKGLVIVENEGKLGLIDRRGKVIIPIIYKEIGEYSSRLIMAFDGQDHIYFNNRGEQQMTIQEQPIGDFVGDHLIVKYRDKYGMINKKKQYVIDPGMDWLEHFENGEARFQLKGKYGLISVNKDTILSADWDFISPKNEGIRLMQKEDQFYYYIRGELSEGYDILDKKDAMFRDGYALVSREGSYGMIDTSFKIILPISSPLTKNLGNGNFAVKHKNLMKLFNVKKAKLGERLYQSLRPGINGDCIYSIRISDGIVDPFENILFQQDSTRIFKLDNYYLLKHDDGKMGLLNEEAQQILELNYYGIDQIKNDVFELISSNGKREILDVKTMDLIYVSSD